MTSVVEVTQTDDMFGEGGGGGGGRERIAQPEKRPESIRLRVFDRLFEIENAN